MGLFDDIGNVASGWAKEAVKMGSDILPISGAVAGAVGGLPGIIYGGLTGEKTRGAIDNLLAPKNQPQPPGEDPALEQMRKQQLDIASGLKDPFGEYQSGKYSLLRNSQLRDLADTNRHARYSMNSRGLYGPGAEGVQAKNVATTSKNLATGKGLIRSGAEEKAREIENSVLNNALEQKQTSQQMYDTIYNNALNEFRQRKEALKSVGQGIGAVAGSAYGGPAAGVGGAYAGGELFS